MVIGRSHDIKMSGFGVADSSASTSPRLSDAKMSEEDAKMSVKASMLGISC